MRSLKVYHYEVLTLFITPNTMCQGKQNNVKLEDFSLNLCIILELSIFAIKT